nr:hypothetical protein CFP56_11857 [Quercus suber]
MQSKTARHSPSRYPAPQVVGRDVLYIAHSGYALCASAKRSHATLQPTSSPLPVIKPVRRHNARSTAEFIVLTSKPNLLSSQPRQSSPFNSEIGCRPTSAETNTKMPAALLRKDQQRSLTNLQQGLWDERTVFADVLCPFDILPLFAALLLERVAIQRMRWNQRQSPGGVLTTNREITTFLLFKRGLESPVHGEL